MDEIQKKKLNETGNELKNETLDTMKNVKDTVRNINIKEEAQNSKSYLADLIQNPIEKIKSIANDNTNKHFKTSIFLLIVWTIVAFINAIYIYNYGFSYFTRNIISILKLTIVPILSVILLSVIILLVNQKNKKSLTTVITTVITAKLPIILADVIGLLDLISSSASRITGPISSFLSVISTLFIFFGIKSLLNIEDERDSINKFAITIALFYVARFIISFLGITVSLL